jgi:hypothetical protein
VTVPYEPDKLERLQWDARELPDADWEGDLWPRGDEDELARRLRNLQWPDVSAELRQRCWEELTRRMPELDGGGAQPDSEQTGDSDPFRRHEFTPRLMPVSGGGALRERVAAVRGLSRPVDGHLRKRSTPLAVR